MKYNENKAQSYVEVADEILRFWKENDVFKRSISEKEGKPTFTFYEGPPSANGIPGIHHVMGRAVKDIFCRYKTLKGFQVHRKGGWDTHGLPVELQVEKELGITKEDIGTKISIADYNQKCREAVMKYTDLWEKITEQMGYWVDMENPYVTYDKKYIESLWHLLKRIYDKGMLYKGYTIQPYSPAAGTGLSSHELNQPGCYKDVKDTSAVAQFKIKDTENDYFLAWTTTPWTLPSNAALAVGEKIVYVKVKTFNPYTFEPVNVILAKELVGKYFTDKQKEVSFADYKKGDKLIPFEILGEQLGSELLGTRYEQLMPYVQPEGDAFRVIAGDFVSTTDGTGIVHIAPTFGADDYRAAMKAGVPAITVKDADGKQVPLVDKQGRFVKEVTDYAGHYVKQEYENAATLPADYQSVDIRISIKLKEANRAFKVEKYEHSYPHCWRTDKPILYYPLDSWFIRTTAVKDRMVELNKTINWKPASTGTGRFGNWLENLVDWNLSRSRFWGAPLPIWRNDSGEEKCIGSISELKEEIDHAVALGFMESNPLFKQGDSSDGIHVEYPNDDFDLHRPYVDDIILASETGKPLRREADLIDVWFDSGAMPFAQWHYPFENKDIFAKSYPADFIAEGVDQTRGWFFTLHAISVMLEDSVAFKNVISNGLVLDKNGNKMSKRLGNTVNPYDTIGKYGPDATRWYMIANAPPWDNLKFNVEGLEEVQRRFFGTLKNTYSFFALYANLDGFSYAEADIPNAERTESDRWILSKLNSLIQTVDESLAAYEPTRAARAIQDFTSDDLSNWYVRLNRKRFWKGEYNEDKISAYQTLYKCLLVIAKLGSSIAPFYMDKIYKDLNAVSGLEKHDSVHLSDFPVVDQSVIDTDLEERMELAQKLSSLTHSLRKKDGLRVRLPLTKILVPVTGKKQKDQITAVADLILSETNVREITFIEGASDILVKKIKPNFKLLGKKFGKTMKAVAAVVETFDQKQINDLERNGTCNIEVEGQTVEFLAEEAEISFADIPGWSVAVEGSLTVALDIHVTEELKEEGIARDIVNRVQNIRKDSGMDVQDKISILVEKGDATVEAAIEKHGDYIRIETQAVQINLTGSLSDATEMEIEGYKVMLKVSKS